jgi:acetolactate synthase-1/2/3 large subunit
MQNVARLAQMADEFGIAVGYPGEPGPREVSIPNDHPMFLGLHPRDAIARADVIVAIDCEVPWWPRYVTPRADAKLIHIAPDPLFARYPLRGFGIDLAITGNTSVALRMLGEALAPAAASRRSAIDARRDVIGKLGQAHHMQLRSAMQSAATAKPILPEWVAACVNEVKKPDTIIVNELGVPMSMLDLRAPRTYLSSSLAGGLGFGLGAALGARLGAPDRDVMTIVGDGSYMFGNPVAAHFVAGAESLPTLTLVMNNSAWHAVRRSTLAMYPDGRAANAGTMPLVALAPDPSYERIMQACGGHGERVEDPRDLVPALRRGLDAVHRGVPALLNIITGTGGA